MSHENLDEVANTTITPEESRHLAEEMNKDMTSTVLPVTIIVGIEAFFAFFGNLLIIYVFVFKYHRCNFKYFVLCLSAIDIISSVTTLPGEIVTQTHWYNYPEPVICKIKSFFNMFTVVSSALCLLVIAVDRFRKVRRPFGWQIKPRVAMILCLVILSIALVISIPVAILWGTHDDIVIYKSKRVTVTVCEIDHDYVHTSTPLKYTHSVSVTIGVTLFVMVVLYVFIVRELFKNKLSKPDESAKQRQAKASKTTELLEVPTLHAQPSNSVEYAYSRADEFTTRSGTTDTSNNMNNSLQTNGNGGVSPRPHVKRKRYRPKSTTERNAIVQRKTIIMLVLTMVFIITTMLYLTLLSLIANDILDGMSNSGKTAYFFFFRLYFINHAVNPWVYGFLDPQFRKVVKNLKSSIITIVSFASRDSSE